MSSHCELSTSVFVENSVVNNIVVTLRHVMILQVVPPYNAQLDKSTEPYFGFIGIQRTLKRTGQVNL